jgi:hypothetical protein
VQQFCKTTDMLKYNLRIQENHAKNPDPNIINKYDMILQAQVQAVQGTRGNWVFWLVLVS